MVGVNSFARLIQMGSTNFTKGLSGKIAQLSYRFFENPHVSNP